MHIMLIAMAMAAMASPMHAQSFATERLQNIAAALGLDSQLPPDAEAFLDASADGKVVYARTDGSGTVAHIGYRIFNPLLRTGAMSAIFDFLERTALEQTLFAAGKLKYADWEYPGDVQFVKGNWETFSSLRADAPDVAVQVLDIESKQCQVSVLKGEESICELYFPIDYSLISGASLGENEENLRRRMQSATSVMAPQPPIGIIEFAEEENRYEATGAPLAGSVLKYKLYYNGAGDDAALLFSPQRPVESMSNLLSSTHLASDVVAKMKMCDSAQQTVEFDIPLRSLIAFFLQDGCVPYLGVYEYDRTSNKISIVMKMHNSLLGYMHLLRVDANVGDIFQHGAQVDVHMHSFVSNNEKI